MTEGSARSGSVRVRRAWCALSLALCVSAGVSLGAAGAGPAGALGSRASTASSADAVVTVTVTTQVSAASAVVGTPFSDAVTVTGVPGSGLPTGTVAFFVCGPSAAAAPCASTAEPVGTASVPGPGDSGDVSTGHSSVISPVVAGTYCFAAVFSPAADGPAGAASDNQGAPVDPAECTDVTGSATTPPGTLATQVTAPVVVLGAAVRDVATVSSRPDGGDASDTVRFFVCGPTPTVALCDSTAQPAGTTSVPTVAEAGPTSSITSDPFVPTRPGFYCFAADLTEVFATEGFGITENTVGPVVTSECAEVVAAAADAPAPTAITTTSAPLPLAFTGHPVGAEVAWAAGLIALGAILVLLARRPVGRQVASTVRGTFPPPGPDRPGPVAFPSAFRLQASGNHRTARRPR